MRRYQPISPSKGTVIPSDIRARVMERDGRCVGPRVGFPTDCAGSLELDHVRASHGIGMKSETTQENLVVLCGSCHRWKTANGKVARPMLIGYLNDDPRPA